MNGIGCAYLRHNIAANAMLTGILESDTQIAFGHEPVRRSGQPFEQPRQERAATNAAGRFGWPEETAALSASWCSAHG